MGPAKDKNSKNQNQEREGSARPNNPCCGNCSSISNRTSFGDTQGQGIKSMFSFAQIPSFILAFILLMFAVSVHEFAHGWVAFKMGDHTARLSGRLTLNPVAHIDLFGTIILPLFIFVLSGGRFIFGAAKPVPVNYLALRDPKRDMVWVALGGPAANILFAIILRVALLFIGPFSSILTAVFETLIIINVVLAVFNLIPIPPLDGSRVVMGLLPDDLARNFARLEPFGFFIIILLISLGLFNIVVLPVVSLILGMLNI